MNCIIPTPNGKVSNLTFGGPKFDILFCTCGDRVYSRKVQVQGRTAGTLQTNPALRGCDILLVVHVSSWTFIEQVGSFWHKRTLDDSASPIQAADFTSSLEFNLTMHAANPPAAKQLRISARSDAALLIERLWIQSTNDSRFLWAYLLLARDISRSWTGYAGYYG